MKLVTCDPLIDSPAEDKGGSRNCIAGLKTDMARLNISAAMVRHQACLRTAPYCGNDILLEEIGEDKSIIPVPIITCDGDLPDYEPGVTVRSMITQGARAVWMSPGIHDFSAAPWCSGELYEALQSLHMPLFLNYGDPPLDTLNEIARSFPRLPIVLLQVPRVGRVRTLYPLLKTYQNLYVCFYAVFSVFDGYRDLCRKFGPERWVWGTGYPQCEGGASITCITYSGMSDDEVEAVAHGNIERLVEEVQS